MARTNQYLKVRHFKIDHQVNPTAVEK